MTDWRGGLRYSPCPQRFRGAQLSGAAPPYVPGSVHRAGVPEAGGCGPTASQDFAPSRPSSSSPRVGVSGSPPGRRGRCRRGRAGPEHGGARRGASTGAAGGRGPRRIGGLAGGPAPCRARRRRARGQGARGLGGGGGGGGRRRSEPLPAPRSFMALPGPPESPRGASRKAPSLLEMGALCLDSEIILGFTSHLLRRRAKVRGGRGDRLAAEALSRGSGCGAGKEATGAASRKPGPGTRWRTFPVIASRAGGSQPGRRAQRRDSGSHRASSWGGRGRVSWLSPRVTPGPACTSRI